MWGGRATGPGRVRRWFRQTAIDLRPRPIRSNPAPGSPSAEVPSAQHLPEVPHLRHIPERSGTRATFRSTKLIADTCPAGASRRP